ncbi:MAG: tripartite tricarboxylate transporter substrate-binding protein [Pseudomonadota bacterium]|nr:tripartite tricarboxylate transporter substrate-binding protein [Pseudomonadota bacterium]
MKNKILKSLAAIAIFTVTATGATAQSAENFYKGKTVEIYIGYGLGGTYGKSATIMGEHLRPRLGADAVIVKSMPGAGGLKMTNYYANVAKKDGTAIILPPDTLAITQMLKPKKAKYDARDFRWLGAAVRSNSLSAVRADSGVKKWQDLKSKSVPFACSGLGSQTCQVPALINGLLGTKIKIVRGYKGSKKMLLAMEQGEAAGINLTWLAYKTNRQEWFQKGFAVPVIQMGPTKDPELQKVPNLKDLVAAKDKPIVNFMSSLIAIGRSLAVHKDTPADRTAFLKSSFVQMAKDPKFIADMKKRKLQVTYTSAEDVHKIVNESVGMSPDIIKRTNQILFGKAS